MLSRRLHLLAFGVFLTVWLTGPGAGHAGTPPESPESVDQKNPPSLDMGPVEREIRSAMMMAMAEARLRAVRDNKLEPPPANAPAARAPTESRDTGSTEQPSREPATSQSDEPETTESTAETAKEKSRQPTFRTLKRRPNASNSAPPKADRSTTESATTDASATNETANEADSNPASVEANVPTFDLSKDSQRAALERLAPRLSLSCDEDCRGKAFVGAFSKRAAKKDSEDSQSEQASNRGSVPVEVAVVQDTTLSIYRRGRLLDSVELGAGTHSVPDELQRIETIRLIDDGTLQILCHWRRNENSEDRESSDVESERETNREAEIYASVHKLVDSYIGTPFQRVIARRPPESKQFERVGEYEFTRREEKAAIRWKSLEGNRDASDDKENETVLIWNHWEGVFRPPGPPPTAPDQTS